MTTDAESPQTPRRRPKDRKQQIVLQARDLFVERGYPSVSMALIADRVGITASALYRHFGNKQVLLEEVIRESFSYLQPGVAGDNLDDAMDDALTRAVEHPYISDLWNFESRYLPDGVRQELRQRMRVWTRSFAAPLHHDRTDLDPWQEDLVTWGLQSVLACLGSAAIREPTSVRRPVVRAAALRLGRAELLPHGASVPRRETAIIPASTRERLLLSAIEQFADRGFQETSMTSIGAAVDVTGPNLYGYFESKVDLGRAVLDRATHTLWLNVDNALRAAQTYDEALRHLVAGHVRLAHTWSHRMNFPGEPELAESNRAMQREYVEEWVAVLRQVVPEIDVREARLRVLIALNVINDLPRTPRLASHENFPANLATLALAVLTDESEGRRSSK